MTAYVVKVQEVHNSYMIIDADSPYEAKEKVIQGQGEELDFMYSHTLNSDNWTVEKDLGD
jgi:hypothetical protein